RLEAPASEFRHRSWGLVARLHRGRREAREQIAKTLLVGFLSERVFVGVAAAHHHHSHAHHASATGRPAGSWRPACTRRTTCSRRPAAAGTTSGSSPSTRATAGTA